MCDGFVKQSLKICLKIFLLMFFSDVFFLEIIQQIFLIFFSQETFCIDLRSTQRIFEVFLQKSILQKNQKKFM